MSERISIRVGDIEVEYEGGIQFTPETLVALVSKIADLGYAVADSPHDQSVSLAEDGADTVPAESASVQLSMANIAMRLECQTGSDLLLAAATRLTLAEGQASFSRDSLRTTMQAAVGYWKKSMSNNLTGYIRTCVKSGEIYEIKPGMYALSVDALEVVKATLDIQG